MQETIKTVMTNMTVKHGGEQSTLSFGSVSVASNSQVFWAVVLTCAALCFLSKQDEGLSVDTVSTLVEHMVYRQNVSEQLVPNMLIMDLCFLDQNT